MARTPVEFTMVRKKDALQRICRFELFESETPPASVMISEEAWSNIGSSEKITVVVKAE